MSPLGVNTAALINENLPSSTKFPTETAVVNFVNNAVSTYSAKFLGTLSLTNDLNLPYTSSNATIAAALNSYQFEDTPSVNDFCFVEIDDPQTTGPDEYRRFSFDGSVWKYQYTINSTAFTPTQWAAINSGVTSQKVSDYDSHLVNQSNPHNVTKEQVGLGNVTNDAQVKRSEMGAANGVPTLDNTTKIPLSQLPIAIDPNNGDTSKFLNERGNFTSVPVVNSFTYEGASSYPNSAPSVPAVVDYVQKSEFIITPEAGKKFFTIAKLKKTDFPERASLKITLAPAATDADTGFAEPQSADLYITCMAQGESTQYDKYNVTIRWYYPSTALYTWNTYPTDGMKEIYLIESGNYIYVVLETAIDTLDLYTTNILCHTDNRAFVFVGTQGAAIPSGTVKAGADFLSYLGSQFKRTGYKKTIVVPAGTDYYEFLGSSYSNSFKQLVFGSEQGLGSEFIDAVVQVIFESTSDGDAYSRLGLGQAVVAHIVYDGASRGYVAFHGSSYTDLVTLAMNSDGTLTGDVEGVGLNAVERKILSATHADNFDSTDDNHVPTCKAVNDFVGTGNFPNMAAGKMSNAAGSFLRPVYVGSDGSVNQSSLGIYSYSLGSGGYCRLATITFDGDANSVYTGCQFAVSWRSIGSRSGSGILAISFSEWENASFGAAISGRVLITNARNMNSNAANNLFFYARKVTDYQYIIGIYSATQQYISISLMSTGGLSSIDIPSSVTTDSGTGITILPYSVPTLTDIYPT
jgi:hypothetical protein